MCSTALSPSIRHRSFTGYSLVELLASLVLIAMIAVLALPTYQDFEPHTDTTEVSAPGEPAPFSSADEASAGGGATVNPAQQTSSGDTGQEPEFDSGDVLAENRSGG